MRAVSILVGSLAALVIGGCASMNVRSDYDREAPLAGFRTYEWVELGPSGADSGLGFDSPLMAQRIQNSVHATLAKRGFERPASGTPDFRVSYRMVAREEVQQLSSYGPYGHGGFGRGFGRFGHGGHGHGGYATSYTRDVVQCILVLDIWDSRSNRLVWRGWARWLLDENPSPEKVTEHIDRAVDRILSEFPPERVGTAPPAVAAG